MKTVILSVLILLTSCSFKFEEPVVATKAAATEESMDITFSSKIEETGYNVTPYKVVINVKTAKDYGLFLAKSTDPMAFFGLNSINPNLPPVTIIPLVPVNSTDFTYEDTSATLGVVYYYAVLKKIESNITITNPNNNSAGLPPPTQITVPNLTPDAYNLNPQVVSQSGQKSKIRVNFNSKTYQMYMKIYVNNVETSEVTIPPNTTYYDVNSIDFQKDYKFKLIRKNGLTEVDSSTSSNVAALWPTLNYGNDITIKVIPRTNIHEYKIEVKDITNYGTYYRIFTSSDNVSFSETSYVSENSVVRTWTDNYSSQTTKYIKVSQYDRNDILMNTSTTFTLKIPLDIYIGTGQTVNASDFDVAGVINVGRLNIFQGQLNANDKSYTINADEILIETCDIINGQYDLTIKTKTITSSGCLIQSFSNASVAVYPNAALNAGNVKLEAENAYGTITFRNKGQKGYTGATGIQPATAVSGTFHNGSASACEWPEGRSYSQGAMGVGSCNNVPSNGMSGTPAFLCSESRTSKLLTPAVGGIGGTGGTSGNSGRITYWVSSIDNMVRLNENTSVTGGAGGAGGSGQMVAKNGYLQNPSGLAFNSWGLYGGFNWYSNCIPYYGASGATGSIGASGGTGQICEKLPNDLIQTCYN